MHDLLALHHQERAQLANQARKLQQQAAKSQVCKYTVCRGCLLSDGLRMCSQHRLPPTRPLTYLCRAGCWRQRTQPFRCRTIRASDS